MDAVKLHILKQRKIDIQLIISRMDEDRPLVNKHKAEECQQQKDIGNTKILEIHNSSMWKKLLNNMSE